MSSWSHPDLLNFGKTLNAQSQSQGRTHTRPIQPSAQGRRSISKSCCREMAVLSADYFVIVVTLGALLITLLSVCAYTIWCCKCCDCPDGSEYPEMNALPGGQRRDPKTFQTTLYMHIPVKSEQIV